MFARIGSFSARYYKWIILAWVVLAAVLLMVAPSLEEVSSADQKDFLPKNAPFISAQKVYEENFPDDFSPSNSMILIDAGPQGDAHSAAIMDYIRKLEVWLNSAQAPENLAQVIAPTTDPQYAEALISPDNRIALVSINIDTPTDSAVTTRAVNAIDDWLKANPAAGFTVYQTGEAALNAQAEKSTFTTMDRTIVITLALVIIALLVIYRSPVSPFIPLFTVTMAYLVTLGLVSILAKLELINVITQMSATLVVVMYGAGTDYCLFLISRFREEMASDGGTAQATKRTVRMVGETITSSAGTVFVGFASLIFSEMGAYRSTGPMLAIGIAISLLAGLTLAPALLTALGNRAFWPGKASHRSHGRWYELTSKQASSRPLVTILIIVALMAPLSIYGLTRPLNYDFVSELPKSIDSVKAYNLLREHMGGGNLFPLTIVATGRDVQNLAADIGSLEADLLKLDNVADVRSLNNPLGASNPQIHNLLRVDGQLTLLLRMAAGDTGSTESVDSQQMAAALAAIQGYLDQTVSRFPEIGDDENLVVVRELLSGDPAQLVARQEELQKAAGGLLLRFIKMPDAYQMPATGEGELFAEMAPLFDRYLTPDRTAYRLELVLDDPLSSVALNTVDEIRDVLEKHQNRGELVVSGSSAMIADLQDVMDRDEIRTFAFVLAGIFLVLLLMLRSVVAPAYLICTVLLSFTCTMGITSIFFRLVFGVDKLSWFMPIFMFVFLVALGIDYSIFLFGRIKEEVGNHGIREGIHVAVAATGAIITSAGIILAGTFAGLMAGEVAFLSQLGFGVSVGVLIDTFVVRTILDPALAALFGRWTWWPGGVPKGEKKPVSQGVETGN